jgi:ABC-2 type transport system permease protein
MVIGLVVLVAVIVAASRTILSLDDADIDVLFVITVLAGSAITLAFGLAPLIAGAHDPLDPRRFAILGMSPGKLAAVLALVGFVSVPTLSLLVLAICTAVAWNAHDVPWSVVALSTILGVATCVMFARVCMALTSLFLRQRRSRELSGLFVLVVLVVVVPVGVFLASLEWHGFVPTQLSQAVSTLAVTPLGAAWALPGLIADESESAWLALLVAVGTLVALGALWAWLVHRMLTTTERPVSNRERGGLGWFGVAPGTPGGAVSARSLMYWFTDRRYIVNMLVIPVAAAITMVPLLIAGVPLEVVVLVPVPFAALFFGWLPHNDVAYDSTALWMHVASGVRGWSDRIGRLVPVLLIGLPLLAIAVPIAISLHGRWALLPALAGICLSLFLCGLGLSSIASVVAPYAVSRPGESPFRQPPRTGAGGSISQALVMLGSIVLSVPVLWWGWVALTDDIEAATMALWGGLVIGVFVLAVGIAIGAAVFERRGGRLMEFVEST